MADMSFDALKLSLKTLLMDSSDKFQADDYIQQLDAALSDLSRVRPLTILGELALVADQVLYDQPDDLIGVLYSNWGLESMRKRKPWNPDWIGRLPKLSLINQTGVRKLILEPAPTQFQIDIIGDTYGYRYSAPYVLGDTDATSNVPEELRQLLLIRALSAAMFALANRGISKPVIVGKAGIGGMPKNGSPAYLADAYMQLFEKLAA